MIANSGVVAARWLLSDDAAGEGEAARRRVVRQMSDAQLGIAQRWLRANVASDPRLRTGRETHAASLLGEEAGFRVSRGLTARAQRELGIEPVDVTDATVEGHARRTQPFYAGPDEPRPRASTGGRGL